MAIGEERGAPPVISIRSVLRRYDPAGPPAVDRLSLDVAQGEVLALLGPSGSGKTTVLRLVAGFERPDAGEVWIAGRPVAGGGVWVPPEARSVGMVFQDYALFPHLTVEENVAFGLHCVQRVERPRRTLEALDLVGMTAFAGRYPHELSGGQQQRVALARALAPQPFAVLLDEPFSNLDADLRAQVRDEVRGILKQTGTSAIFVTHDQQEALVLGDRVGVLQQGRLEQVDTPERIFHMPRTRFVARFLGRADFLPARVTAQGLQTEVGVLPQRPPLGNGDDVEILVRPDDIAIAPAAGGAGIVIRRLFQGGAVLYCIELPSGRRLHSLQPHTVHLEPGARVDVRLAPGHPLACFLNGQAVAAVTDAAPGEPARAGD
ncbi:MAG: ABC transporter ATP-binding protein [Armatimonadota bacterium]|nr:ABC transporter ATP-binding protein [Armatimonadota bacterium]MDR7532494.1 ABC transporter ATP-binding protein [Armatimonadota bacterium]MDR7535615.1 ABC transporter ATP-binding protein [Armatimonadota bacterium]